MKARPNETEALAALEHGRYDISAFCREVLAIEPNAAQIRWFKLVNPQAPGWRWRYKLVIHVAANQIGKTLGVGVLILWACSYKIGVEPPPTPMTEKGMRDWLSRPYPWFHLAPSQQQAYIPLEDIVLIIQGAHPAQDEGRRRGLTFHWLPGMVSEGKAEQYYRALHFWNGAVCQFRTTEDKARALQGRRAAGISFDEAAFEDHLKSVVNETLMMRLVALDGPLLMDGTPNGINDYYDFVEEITQHGEERPFTVPTDANPEERVWVRGEGAVAWSVAQDNIGFGLTQGAVDLMESNLDESTKEQQLRGAFLEPAEAFFTPPAAVFGAFKANLPELSGPLPGHTYVIAWDPSVASDPTAAVVLDITPGKMQNGEPRPWVGVALKHHKKPLGINELIQEVWATHLLFNSAEDPKGVKSRSRAITVYDATAMGGQMVKQLLVGIHPSRPINFGGPSAKMQMLTNLRAALAKRKLILPEAGVWVAARRELANYRLNDQKITQDIVMALAMAASIAASGFSGEPSRPFSVSGRI